MAYEKKPGDIVVYKEKEKQSEKAPDWKGTAIAHRDIKAGEVIAVAFWQKSPTMLAGQISDPRAKKETSGEPPRKAAAPKSADMDDEIPF